MSGGQVVCIVHGGAGFISDAVVPTAKSGVSEACLVGYNALISGKSALDAVELAVRKLEDLPFFNAGTGSVLNAAGDVEMDALIVDGKSVNAGAVTMVKTVKNPISLARQVMENTPHVLIGGEGAELFARSIGLETVDPATFKTASRLQQLQETLARGINVTAHQDPHAAVGDGTEKTAEPTRAEPIVDVDEGDHDTVGAVAIDQYGNVAAATSTGGLTAKMIGRIGDSPLLGAGGYADNESGACSTTGSGEFIIRSLLAKAVCDAFENHHDASVAVQVALERMRRKVGGPGAGVIFVSPTGEIGVGHTSERMSWAACAGTSEADKRLTVEAEIKHQPVDGVKVMPQSAFK